MLCTNTQEHLKSQAGWARAQIAQRQNNIKQNNRANWKASQLKKRSKKKKKLKNWLGEDEDDLSLEELYSLSIISGCSDVSAEVVTEWTVCNLSVPGFQILNK